jgi:hypothetical protein
MAPRIVAAVAVVMVDLERDKFAAAEAVDRHAHVGDELAKARFLILRHYLACLLPLRLSRHKPRPIRTVGTRINADSRHQGAFSSSVPPWSPRLRSQSLHL